MVPLILGNPHVAAQKHARKKSSRKLRARLINAPTSRLARLGGAATNRKGGVEKNRV